MVSRVSASKKKALCSSETGEIGIRGRWRVNPCRNRNGLTVYCNGADITRRCRVLGVRGSGEYPVHVAGETRRECCSNAGGVG